ncbi:MAG: GNAT family acetyltransferase [Granulosicoccus sp.]
MNALIRSFKEEDTASVIGLWVACELVRPWNDATKDIQRKCLQNDELFLVAIVDEPSDDEPGDDELIIGTVMAGYEGHRGWINYLAVHPDYRNLELGRKLMQAAEEKLLSLGCPKINLQIRADNAEVLQFYSALGFSDDHCISLGKRLIHDD